MLKFSVLISVYHKERSEWLKDSLESIVNQTLPPNEILLVKDGELTPELESVISEFITKNPGLFKIVALKKNQGLGVALQKGLERCTYEVIARMDSDDICKKNRFEKQMIFLKNHPEITIVGSSIAEFKDTIESISSYRTLPKSHDDIVTFSKKRCPLNHMTVLFRKKDILSVGGYQKFSLFEDYFLWIRLLNKGYLFANISEPLVYARSNHMIKRRSGWKYASNEMKLQRQFYRMGFTNILEMGVNIILRTPPKLLPSWMLSYIYKFFLRRK